MPRRIAISLGAAIINNARSMPGFNARSQEKEDVATLIGMLNLDSPNRRLRF